MAAAIVTGDGVAASGVVGVRKLGTEVPATLEDRWHLGSDTKALTAALVGSLVDGGLLRWDTSVAEVFPELVPTLHPGFRDVTVLHLLSHRAGLPENPGQWLLVRSWTAGEGAARAQRLQVLKEALSKAPLSAPGTSYLYSNLGYVVAGAMVERRTGTSWEAAIRQRVFEPLGMRTAGFGGTGTRGRVDQPWGHLEGGRPVRSNGPSMDNPPIFGPAGRVHCALWDWAGFVADQLRGARGRSGFLRGETYRTLHAPPFGGDYALGWLVVERDWGGGTVLNHAGDNTMNHANAWIAPRRDFAILVCVNQGGETASRASDEAVGALLQLCESRVVRGADD